jgi:transcriptional regulator with XRE-family HTH domain
MPIDRVKLRAVRSAKGLTQERLAVAAKLSRAGLQNIEAGRAQPRHDTIVALARALHVPVKAITHGDPQAVVEAGPPRSQGTDAPPGSDVAA